MRKIYNSVGEILKKFKQLQFHEKSTRSIIVRNLAFGQPSGARDLAKFEKWSQIYSEQQIDKQKVRERTLNQAYE